MNKNIKIAKQLIKIAKSLIASPEKVNLVIDYNGNVSEINDSEFNQYFNAIRVAGVYPTTSKSVIYVSPDINATNVPGSGIRGLFTRIYNTVCSILNRISSNKIIYQTMRQNEDPQRGNVDGYYQLGCTIEKGKGVYSNDGKLFKENSYIVTIYGATKEETDKIANALKDAFAQEMVLVEYNQKIISDNPDTPDADDSSYYYLS